MVSQSLAPHSAALERVTRARASLLRTVYTVPHVCPSAAPAYAYAPRVVRSPLHGDQLRLGRERRFLRWLTRPERSVAPRLPVDVVTLRGRSPRLACVGLRLVLCAAAMRLRYGIRRPPLVPLYSPYRWRRALRGAR